MRAYKVAVMMILVLPATPSLAAPIQIPAMVRRKDFCTNAPTTIAGSTFDRRTLVSGGPVPRGNPHPTYWCAENGKTYVMFKAVTPVAGTVIRELLDEAYSYVQGTISLLGDGLVPGWGMNWARHGFSVRAKNANNHQITMGVLGAAIDALRDYVVKEGGGTLTFDIYDGENQVGIGSIAPDTN